MLDKCKVENAMDSWAATDSIENGSDSSGYDTSDCGAVGALIFPRLLYPGTCSNWLFLVLAMWCVRVLYVVAFSNHGTAFRHPQCVCVKLYIADLSTNLQPTVSEAAGSLRSE